jgi:glycerol-3-phosphate dehydrogenase
MFSELEPYFGKDYDYKNNLLSSWAGIRPLVKESKGKSQEQIEKENKEWLSNSLWVKTKHHLANGIRGLAKIIHYKK